MIGCCSFNCGFDVPCFDLEINTSEIVIFRPSFEAVPQGYADVPTPDRLADGGIQGA